MAQKRSRLRIVSHASIVAENVRAMANSSTGELATTLESIATGTYVLMLRIVSFGTNSY